MGKLGEKIIGVGAQFLAKGSEALMDSLESTGRTELKPAIDKLPTLPEDVPEEIRALQAKALEAPGAWYVIPLIILGVAMSVGSLVGLVQTSAASGSLTFERWLKTFRFGPAEVSNLWLRGFPNTDEAERWFEDLKDHGADDRRIAAIKELAHYLPSPTEVMTWAAREVFEPELREKYQLDTLLPPDYLAWAEKVGITGEVAKNYWAAHWVLPSITNIIELWRREVLTKEDVDAFWTELDMVPWIRESLFKLFREVPTRVDVRRWWDMRTIDESRLRQIYKAQGYWDEDLEDYVTWTKVYTDFPDLVARYKNGWITLEEVKSTLLADGMPEDRMTELLEAKFKKAASPERVAKERDLTKSEIYRGVKKDIITREQGVVLLQGMGYDLLEAEYIIAVNVEAGSSPETYGEFKRMVDGYRKAQGMEVTEVPQEVIDAEKLVIRLTKDLEKAIADDLSQDTIDRLTTEKVEAMTRYRELLILHGL